MSAQVQSFHDPVTGTVTHVVYEQAGSACAIVDPVLDYDAAAGRTHTGSAEKVLAFIRAYRLCVEWILETHAHADHLSAAAWLRGQVGGQVGIGRDITRVQRVFKGLFNLEPDFATDGRQFDRLFGDGERFTVGALVQCNFGERRLLRIAGVPVGRHLADQMMAPLALGQGGSYRTMALTQHALTNAAIVKLFTGVTITATTESRDVVRVDIERAHT